MMNRRGFVLTIGIILMILPLIFLIIYYNRVSETITEDKIGKIRCDELHYFIEDVRRDMERSAGVFGRRAAVYALDKVLESSTPFESYNFTCSSSCKVDCMSFTHPDEGSEAAIAELVACGTLYGENSTYMINHTIPEWIQRIREHAEEMNFILELNISSIEVIPKDAWHFALIIDYRISARDKEGLCYFTENIITSSSDVSIIGLEDPLYVLQTGGSIVKYIINCSPEFRAKTTAGCSKSDLGSGIGTGLVVYYSEIRGNSEIENKGNFCNDNADRINELILVMDDAIGNCNQFGDDCFNVSKPNHFAGVIDYGPNDDKSIVGKCNVTIPWILDTGKLDDDTGSGKGWARLQSCAFGNITRGGCVVIYNDPDCSTYEVRIGYDSNKTNTSCYMVSDVVEYYNSYCPDALSNGPSFFDRLDGNLNLSEKYVNQSLEYFNTSLIGIETLVNLYDLSNYHRAYPNIPIYENASWVDYLYWQGVYGCGVSGVCRVGNFVFNLDCPHARKFRVSTDCVTVRECEICGDQVCGVGENCVNCVSDCDCPGCPVYAGLTACGKSIGGNKYNVTFMLYVRDRNLTLFNLSGLPNITVTVKGFPALYTMSKAGSGIYSYTKRDVDKNYKILGNITLTQPLILAGCPTLTNRTEEKKASELSTC